MPFIGLDIGTSFIKGAILDLDQLRLESIQRVPFPEPLHGLPPCYREFDPEAITRAVRGLLDALLVEPDECEGILMCAQMHGLVFTSPQGQPRSNLISWQDQRTLDPHPSGQGSYFDVLSSRISPEERRQLGNELRPGLPVGMLFWMAEQGRLPQDGGMPAALPDFVLANLCAAAPATETTHAMSHGLLNLETLGWHTEVIKRLGLSSLTFPPIHHHGTVNGWVDYHGRKIRCYTPVGDYQAALAGAMLRPGELSINISTGSQVSLLLSRLEFGEFQTRPYFDGRFLSTITHIPAGRSLNALVRLLSELAESQGLSLTDPWPYIVQQASQVSNRDLRVDLAFFNSPMGDHGSITGVRDEELTTGHLFRAAFEHMADNYLACALRISPSREWRNLVLSGGLAQKIPLLRELIANRFQSGYRLCATTEDTLLGLLALGLVFTGRLPDLESATALLEQKYLEP